MAATVLPELEMMNTVASIMAPLSNGERRRVIAWLDQYFKDDVDADQSLPEAFEAAGFPQAEEEVIEEEPVDDFATFYAKIAPKTAWQRAATSAWWLETREDNQEWKTSAMTKLLRINGINTKNLSMAVGLHAKGDDPVFNVMSKAGDSMQARKTYQLAARGRAFIEDRL